MPILTCADIKVDYGAVRAVDGVSFDIPTRGVTAILGPSGSGKTSVLRAIAGFVPLDGGAIMLKGRTLSDASRTVPPEQRGIGIAVQDRSLFPHLTARQNVAFGLKGRGRNEAADGWLERIGLAHRASAYPHELSGGEQQRIALARALAPGPDLMLLDEAFSSLDPDLRAQLRRETLRVLREAETPAMIVTHDPDEAMEVADTLIVMDKGRVLQSGAPDTVYLRPADRVVARLLGDVNIFEGRIEKGELATPFGPLACDEVGEGGRVEAFVRPRAIRLEAAPSGEACRVDARQFLGSQWRLEVLSADGERLVVLSEEGGAFPVGSAVRVIFDAQSASFVEQAHQ